MLPNLPLFFINRMLRDEDWARQRLLAHSGQTARLELGAFTLRMKIGEDGLLQPADAAAGDDVCVTLPATAFATILEDPSSVTQQAHIEGSAALADTLATLLQHLRPDLAAWLAPLVGDIAAVRASRLAAGASRSGMQAIRHGENLVRGLLQERLQSAVPHAEFDRWKNDVEALNLALASLEARLRR